MPSPLGLVPTVATDAAQLGHDRVVHAQPRHAGADERQQPDLSLLGRAFEVPDLAPAPEGGHGLVAIAEDSLQQEDILVREAAFQDVGRIARASLTAADFEWRDAEEREAPPCRFTAPSSPRPAQAVSLRAHQASKDPDTG